MQSGNTEYGKSYRTNNPVFQQIDCKGKSEGMIIYRLKRWRNLLIAIFRPYLDTDLIQ